MLAHNPTWEARIAIPMGLVKAPTTVHVPALESVVVATKAIFQLVVLVTVACAPIPA
jgi:hypothetical protein